MKPLITMRAALNDPMLLGAALDGPSWDGWRVLLIAMIGERLNASERAKCKELTHLDHEPGMRVDEFIGIIGRRGGKSKSISVLVCYVAALCDYSSSLVAGETAVALIIAPDQRQASIILEYCFATLQASERLKQLIKSRTADTIALTSGISIEVRASSFRRLRGPTYLLVVGDESAFYMNVEGESANPDSAIFDAVKPGLATTHGMLVLISSPYAKKGLIWDYYRRYYGPGNTDRKVLVAQASSRAMNPTLSDAVVNRALERDHAAASAEYLAQFRSDLAAFVAREIVESCVVPGTYELPPKRGTSYFAFGDPSGGSGSDSMALAICHMEYERETVVVDALREQRPPFSPEQVSKEFCTLMLAYNISTCISDRFGGEWVAEQMSKFGIHAEQSAKAKSELYLDLLATLNSGRVELLDHPRAVTQICSLERRTRAGGRASIDAPSGQHEDVANAIA